VASGIYKITCLSNGKSYIGSAVNIEQRWRQHRNALNKGVHDNAHLQNAWNKYDASNFEFAVIELTKKPQLIEAEQRWIDSFSVGMLFNICLVAGSTLGHNHSEETRKKIGLRSLGRTHSPENRQKMSLAIRGKIWNAGKHLSEEIKTKISVARKGKNLGNKSVYARGPYKHSEEAKKKISEANIGKQFTKEHCRHIAVAKAGHKPSEETRRKMSVSKMGNTNLLGHLHSEETKQRISEASKRIWTKRRETI